MARFSSSAARISTASRGPTRLYSNEERRRGISVAHWQIAPRNHGRGIDAQLAPHSQHRRLHEAVGDLRAKQGTADEERDDPGPRLGLVREPQLLPEIQAVRAHADVRDGPQVEKPARRRFGMADGPKHE